MIYAFRPVNLLSLVCLFAHFCIVPYHNMDNLLSLSREGDIVGPFVVNDVSGGSEEMWSLLGRLHLPYIAMHTRGTPKNMQSLTDYDNVTEAVRHVNLYLLFNQASA